MGNLNSFSTKPYDGKLLKEAVAQAANWDEIDVDKYNEKAEWQAFEIINPAYTKADIHVIAFAFHDKTTSEWSDTNRQTIRTYYKDGKIWFGQDGFYQSTNKIDEINFYHGVPVVYSLKDALIDIAKNNKTYSAADKEVNYNKSIVASESKEGFTIKQISKKEDIGEVAKLASTKSSTAKKVISLPYAIVINNTEYPLYMVLYGYKYDRDFVEVGMVYKNKFYGYIIHAGSSEAALNGYAVAFSGSDVCKDSTEFFTNMFAQIIVNAGLATTEETKKAQISRNNDTIHSMLTSNIRRWLGDYSSVLVDSAAYHADGESTRQYLGAIHNDVKKIYDTVESFDADGLADDLTYNAFTVALIYESMLANPDVHKAYRNILNKMGDCKPREEHGRIHSNKLRVEGDALSSYDNLIDDVVVFDSREEMCRVFIKGKQYKQDKDYHIIPLKDGAYGKVLQFAYAFGISFGAISMDASGKFNEADKEKADQNYERIDKISGAMRQYIASVKNSNGSSVNYLENLQNCTAIAKGDIKGIYHVIANMAAKLTPQLIKILNIIADNVGEMLDIVVNDTVSKRGRKAKTATHKVTKQYKSGKSVIKCEVLDLTSNTTSEVAKDDIVTDLLNKDSQNHYENVKLFKYITKSGQEAYTLVIAPGTYETINIPVEEKPKFSYRVTSIKKKGNRIISYTLLDFATNESKELTPDAALITIGGTKHTANFCENAKLLKTAKGYIISLQEGTYEVIKEEPVFNFRITKVFKKGNRIDNYEVLNLQNNKTGRINTSVLLQQVEQGKIENARVMHSTAAGDVIRLQKGTYEVVKVEVANTSTITAVYKTGIRITGYKVVEGGTGKVYDHVPTEQVLDWIDMGQIVNAKKLLCRGRNYVRLTTDAYTTIQEAKKYDI